MKEKQEFMACAPVIEADRGAPSSAIMASHTPGPWKIVGKHEDGDRIISRSTYDTICGIRKPCNVVWTIEDESTITANARLIAAAPTMADLLRDGLRYMSPAERNAWRDRAAAVMAALAVHGEPSGQARIPDKSQGEG